MVPWRFLIGVKTGGTLHGCAQVDALERQMGGLVTLRSLVQEMQASVEGLASAHGDLRAEVTQHCTHTSSLLTHLQVRWTAASSEQSLCHLAVLMRLRTIRHQ